MKTLTNNDKNYYRLKDNIEMKERCIILNGNGTKNIVPVERIAVVSLKENENNTGFNATFYIDNAITITLSDLSAEETNKVIDIMQYKV